MSTVNKPPIHPDAPDQDTSSAADQGRQRDNDSFDLSRMSPQEIATELARRSQSARPSLAAEAPLRPEPFAHITHAVGPSYEERQRFKAEYVKERFRRDEQEMTTPDFADSNFAPPPANRIPASGNDDRIIVAGNFGAAEGSRRKLNGMALSDAALNQPTIGDEAARNFAARPADVRDAPAVAVTARDGMISRRIDADTRAPDRLTDPHGGGEMPNAGTATRDPLAGYRPELRDHISIGGDNLSAERQASRPVPPMPADVKAPVDAPAPDFRAADLRAPDYRFAAERFPGDDAVSEPSRRDYFGRDAATLSAQAGAGGMSGRSLDAAGTAARWDDLRADLRMPQARIPPASTTPPQAAAYPADTRPPVDTRRLADAPRAGSPTARPFAATPLESDDRWRQPAPRFRWERAIAVVLILAALLAGPAIYFYPWLAAHRAELQLRLSHIAAMIIPQDKVASTGEASTGDAPASPSSMTAPATASSSTATAVPASPAAASPSVISPSPAMAPSTSSQATPAEAPAVSMTPLSTVAAPAQPLSGQIPSGQIPSGQAQSSQAQPAPATTEPAQPIATATTAQHPTAAVLPPDIDTAAGKTSTVAPAATTLPSAASQPVATNLGNNVEIPAAPVKQKSAAKPLKAKSTFGTKSQPLDLTPSPAWLKAQPYDPDNAAQSGATQTMTAPPQPAQSASQPAPASGAPDAWMKARPYDPGVLMVPVQ